jgi:lipopolysaccharide export system permease protein
MATPVGFLLAILLGMGRLGEDREIAAIRALGVGPWQLLAIPAVMGILLGALMLLLASTLEPRGLSAVKGLVNEIIKKNLIGDVRPGIFYEDLTNLTLYAERVSQERGTWSNVLVHDDRDPAAPLLVMAREGRVNPAGQGEWIKLALVEGRVHRASRATADYAVVSFERAEINVGVEGRIARKNRFRSAREEMTPLELLESAREEQAAGGDPKPMLVSFYSVFGQALTPVAFALFGTPFAIGGRKGGRARGLLITVGAYISYYVLSRVFDNLAVQGRIPILLAVLVPALIIGLAGAVAMYRYSRVGASA